MLLVAFSWLPPCLLCWFFFLTFFTCRWFSRFLASNCLYSLFWSSQIKHFPVFKRQLCTFFLAASGQFLPTSAWSNPNYPLSRPSLTSLEKKSFLLSPIVSPNAPINGFPSWSSYLYLRIVLLSGQKLL